MQSTGEILHYAPVVEPRPSILRFIRTRIPWFHIGMISLMLLVAAGTIDLGLKLRRSAWTWTEDVRFVGDIQNGYRWGTDADEHGLFPFYEQHVTSQMFNGRRNDYTPLRLAVMTTWVHWTKQHFPHVDSWQESYEFSEPLLQFNTACELSSSILIFFIIRLWSVRADDARRPPGVRPRALRGTVAGFAGALMFWFNPAIIWTGHCWPQWDVWLAPFFLAAVLLGSLEWWFSAGMCIMIGAFLKGQMLLGAPVLLMWPLFRGQFAAVFKILCGCVFAAAAIVLPWMQLSTDAIRWCELVAFSPLLIAPLVFSRTRLKWYWALGLAIAGIWIGIPWKSAVESPTWELGLFPIGMAIALPLLPRGSRKQGYGLILGSAVFLTIPLFNGGTGWYTIGFEYGAQKYATMMTGNGSWNIPAMLVKYYGWSRNDPDATLNLPFAGTTVTIATLVRGFFGVGLLIFGFTAFRARRRRTKQILAGPAIACFGLLIGSFLVKGYSSSPDAALNVPLAGEEVTIAMLLRGIYGICLVLCGIAAAHASRRREKRFLAALAAPWLCCFLLMTQMHGRYSIWAAGFSALLAGVSTGMALLGMVVAVVACMGIIENQYIFESGNNPWILSTLRSLDPGLGWVYVVAALVYLFVAIAPVRRPYRTLAGTSV